MGGKNSAGAPAIGDLDKLSQANKEANESILEYVNFPDPQLYLIGFETSYREELISAADTSGSHARR